MISVLLGRSETILLLIFFKWIEFREKGQINGENSHTNLTEKIERGNDEKNQFHSKQLPLIFLEMHFELRERALNEKIVC